jgi:hypothetical protein
VDGGTLNEQVNFAVNQVADPTKPGLQALIANLMTRADTPGAPLSPERLVDGCLDLAGPLEVTAETRGELLNAATAHGALGFATDEERQRSAEQISRLLQLIVASREYQLA